MKVYQENELVENEQVVSGEEYLLAKASEQGFVTYKDILTAFPHAEENLEELEDLLATLMEAGVDIGMPEEEKEDEEPEASNETEPSVDQKLSLIHI